MKYRCAHCTTSFPTKKITELHTTICTMIHSVEQTSSETLQISVPSKETMFQYLIHLTEKYQQLEKRMDQMQKTAMAIKKKTVKEYLQTHEPPNKNYTTWLSEIKIHGEDLEVLFEDNLLGCIKSVLGRYIAREENRHVPLFAFQQKPNYLYVYENEWRVMTQQEIENFVYVISHRVLKKYMEWENAHRIEIENNAKMQENAMYYLSKANGIHCRLDMRVAEIKKWVFSRVNQCFRNIEV